ncbi:hypothetical protein F7R06_16730 [Pseudomonas moorei]|nr:hypothetical protein F7R06_16730 [Pseudomonas moorei]
MMDVNDNAGCLNSRGVRAFFASRLAPTVLIGLSDPQPSRPQAPRKSLWERACPRWTSTITLAV